MHSPTGRHRLPSRGRPGRLPVLVAVVGSALILGAAVVVPAADRTADPIDADPVAAFAVVVSAPGCTADPVPAVVDVPGLAGASGSATLDACGLPAGQRVAVEYLRGEPSVVRLAGTSTAGAGTVSGRWEAAALAVSALLAVLATVVLVGSRRGPRPDHPTVTVPELIARLTAPPPAVRPVGSVARVAQLAGQR